MRYVCCILVHQTKLVAYHQCILPPSVNTSLCCCCQCCNKMHQEGQRWETFATIYFYCITYSPSANNVSFCWWKATSICNCAHQVYFMFSHCQFTNQIYSFTFISCWRSTGPLDLMFVHIIVVFNICETFCKNPVALALTINISSFPAGRQY